MADRDPICLYLVGTAGAGKSTLAGAFKEWSINQGIDAIIVNLDPGAESLPYTPDVDVREWVNLRDLMQKEGLGPNGAQVAASDLLALNASKIREAIDKFETKYVILDTPGQIELFVFRESGKYLIQFLYPAASILTFLFDPFLARTPNGFVSQLLLATSVQFRLNLPTGHFLTKADLLTDEEMERIMAWSRDADALQSAFDAEEPDAYRNMGSDLLRVMEALGALPELRATSAINLEGLDEVYAHMTSVNAGGDEEDK